MTTMKRLRTFGRRACLQAAFWFETEGEELRAGAPAVSPASDPLYERAAYALEVLEAERRRVPQIERPDPEHLVVVLRLLDRLKGDLERECVATCTSTAEEDDDLDGGAARDAWKDDELAAILAEKTAVTDVRSFLEQLASATEVAPFRCLVVDGISLPRDPLEECVDELRSLCAEISDTCTLRREQTASQS